MEINLTESMKNIVAKGIQTDVNSPYSGPGYITEKLYMLLQLYLQNKGWNPSLELLQCFTDLKESSMLPSGAYLQMLASRVALDSQGRLVLRENGKIILPFEHFVNAIMLKHMNGPHGLHLSLEATIRAVVDSYTIGRDNFGMEKELIIEVVQNCPNPTCRFYKNPADINQHQNSKSETSSATTSVTTISITTATNSNENISTNMAPPPQPPISISLTPPSRPLSRSPSQPPSRPPSVDLTPAFESTGTNGSNNSNNGNSKISPETPSPPPITAPLPPPSPKLLPMNKPLTARQQQQNKLADFLKANLENFDKVVSESSMNDCSSLSDDGRRQDAGQEKIIRVFSEIMKNMGRMKSCVRPAMCKPYGKQSEALQKTVIDTIQLVQSLRSYLPPPHIAVSSWKNDDKHGRLERKTNSCATLPSTVASANTNTGVSLVSSGTMTVSTIATSTTPMTTTTTTNVMTSALPVNTAVTNNGVMVNVSTNATVEDLTDLSVRNKMST